MHDNTLALKAFNKKKVQESDKAKEIYLTGAELQALYEMKLDGLKETVRDVFLVGCYTCQRFSDYSRLERENFTTTAKGTRIVRIVQEKTGNSVVIPILNDNLLHIAEKYDYEIPQVNDVVLNRYIKQILKELAENDMITKEEFLAARQSNIGGLLPLTNAPAGITADKPVPSPDVIIERINALKAATEERAITPREFSAERDLIIEAILPPAPRQRLKRQAPAKDLLSAAKNLRKLEVIYDLDLITTKEKQKEQAAIERNLGINTSKAPTNKNITPAESLEPHATAPISTAPQMPELPQSVPAGFAPQPLIPDVSSPFNG